MAFAAVYDRNNNKVWVREQVLAHPLLGRQFTVEPKPLTDTAPEWVEKEAYEC